MRKRNTLIDNIDKPEYKVEEYDEMNFNSDVTIPMDYREV
jgi:hypothetical protein